MGAISVLLADDHTVVRQGLRALLAAQPDLLIVGEAANGQEAVRLARELKPDLVLMDLAMPILNGIDATRQILSEFPSIKITILSSYDVDQYVRETIQANASGYLLKHTAAEDLLQAIREAKKGNLFFSPAIARRLRQQSGGLLTRHSLYSHGAELTHREAQVLKLISQGHANKDMAAELGISVKTVEKHRQRVMKKLGIHDIAGLTRYAVTLGLLDSGANTGTAAA